MLGFSATRWAGSFPHGEKCGNLVSIKQFVAEIVHGHLGDSHKIVD